MMKFALSSAAAGLLRALLARCSVKQDRTLLRNFQSTDWQSLTFNGERHQIELRIAGPDAEILAERLITGFPDAEFSVPGHLVADIALARPPIHSPDGSISLHLEALTIAEDGFLR